MKRLIALILALCLLPGACMAAQDYTVAEKLLRQLWAGSGFSGTLTACLTTDALYTGPIALDFDYIYVRPYEENTGEHRLDLTLMDGESAISAACAQYKDAVLSFQADVISPDWYAYERMHAAQPSPAQAAVEGAAQQTLAKSGVPSLLEAVAAFALTLPGAPGLEDALEPYKTRIDVWIEEYRQDAVLDKLEDGTTTMAVSYAVAPAAIKTQMKQMVLDMLLDKTLMGILADALSEDQARLFLNPQLQRWYFEVIDEMPLEGELIIRRLVSLKGDTLNLHISLPLYDAAAGNAAIVYDCASGGDDLPDSHTLRLETGTRTLEALYQQYSSMTGVEVTQGTLRMMEAQKESALSFTLKQNETTTVDAEGREVYGYDLTLDLAPGQNCDFSPAQIALRSRFMSKELKSAATEMEAFFTVEDENQLVELSLHGTSRKKWEPEEIPQERVNVHDLTQQDIASILPGAAIRLTALFAGLMEQ